MDDARIRQLTEEVLGQISQPRAEEVHDLESRVARLEAEVRSLRAALGAGAPAAAPAVTVATATVVRTGPATHPSLRVLDVRGCEDDGRCVLEPEHVCDKSGRCKTLGF